MSEGVTSLQPGQRFGRYLVEAQLGEGGMATVVRAHAVEAPETPVALKILTFERRADVPGLLPRLEREASVLQALQDSPYVVDLRERFEDPATRAHVLVLELIDGEPLSSLSADTPMARLVEVMGHACHALHDIHQAGFLHRDLKPDNLLVVDDPDVPVRVIDFNSAGPAVVGGRLTRAQGAFPHTPAYLAPECFDGVPPHRGSDVYALCLTFAEVVVGHHPAVPPGTQEPERTSAWQALHEQGVLRDSHALPAPLRDVLERGCHPEPSERIADAAELWEALKEVWDALARAPVATAAAATPAQTGTTVPTSSAPASSESPAVRTARPDRGRRQVAALGLASAVLVGLGIAGWLTLGGSSGSFDPVVSGPPPALDTGGTVEPVRTVTTYGTVLREAGLAMVPVDAVSYLQGKGSFDNWNDGPTPRQVTLTRPFLIGTSEVTQGLWKRVSSEPEEPWNEITVVPFFEGEGPCGRFGRGDAHPVACVTWPQALRFCNALSQLEGLQPAYSFSGDEVTWDRDADGYRLPTEAEWELAARGGEDHHFSGSNQRSEVAWHEGNTRSPSGHRTGRLTHPVAQKKPNAFGLYDMTGNVQELTWDVYLPAPSPDPYYGATDYLGDTTDPIGPGGLTVPLRSAHAMRGGSVLSKYDASHVWIRVENPALAKDAWLGFRLARNQ